MKIFIAIIICGLMNTGTQADTGPRPMVTGLNDARDIRISTIGNIFVAESGNHRVLKISGDGERMDSIGRLGNGDYQFDTPIAIDPTNELKIYVADRNNRRIQVFDRRLQYLSTIMLPGRVAQRPSYRPMLLTVDASGRLYFFDDERHLMFRFDSNGQFDLSFELFSEDERILPVAMDIRDHELWVIGDRGTLLHRFSSGGSYLGFLHTPEPARSLRIDGEHIWLLGEANLIRLDTRGEISFSVPLPDAVPENRRRRARRTRDARWRGFDINDRHIYLLDASQILKIELDLPDEDR